MFNIGGVVEANLLVEAVLVQNHLRRRPGRLRGATSTAESWSCIAAVASVSRAPHCKVCCVACTQPKRVGRARQPPAHWRCGPCQRVPSSRCKKYWRHLRTQDTPPNTGCNCLTQDAVSACASPNSKPRGSRTVSRLWWAGAALPASSDKGGSASLGWWGVFQGGRNHSHARYMNADCEQTLGPPPARHRRRLRHLEVVRPRLPWRWRCNSAQHGKREHKHVLDAPSPPPAQCGARRD